MALSAERNPAVVALGPAGADIARRLVTALPGAQLHGLRGRVTDADVSFDGAAGHLQSLFAAGTPIVGVCAAGILIRALAPLLADKRDEPPVVAVAADGSTAVPLLGGHHGANALARAAAQALGSTAAITTAGDTRLGFALDEPPPGWCVRNPDAAKAVSAALLAGEPVALAAETGDAGWLRGARFAHDAALSVRLTARNVAGSAQELVLHPAVLALGVGCERGAEPAELIGLARATLARHELAAQAIACVVSLDVKADEPALDALATELGVPARFFDAATLEAETPRLANPSDAVFAAVGCHGVAEAAALAAAGPDGALVAPKTRSPRATCAVAEAPAVIDADSLGRARGRLAIVGIGPGGDAWRSPEASAAIAAASDLVGYGLYLDLLAPLAAGKARHAFALGDEEPRARAALDLAAGGRDVVLVSSGDAGIYAMAALVFELLAREDRGEWNRVAVTVVPGISALQAAAARAGAPLGHDFCAISLSDLLTPWPAIEARLEAAAEGDFVVALYNPVSGRRREGLARARDILLERRPAETPVVLARNLGREHEELRTVPLAELAADDADMVTLVIVGSSATRRFRAGVRDWVYTPRGYAAKRGKPP
ncbi:MAG: precorrin-3B C(17)-methyltransferase [Alphaproteobacteria bacterium]